MSTEPLRPFSPPTGVFENINLIVPSGVWVEWVLYGVFVLWAIFTLVGIYHWLRYSHASLVAFPAIGVHLFVSFSLMAYTLSGNLSL